MTMTVSEAGRLGGRARTEAKGQAARANGARGGRKVKALAEYACACPNAPQKHNSQCPRWQAILRQRRRERARAARTPAGE